MKVTAALLFASVAGCVSAANHLWTLNSLHERELFPREALRNPRFQSIDFPSSSFFRVSEEVRTNLVAGQEYEFEIPNGDALEKRVCVLQNGNTVVPQALADKFPEVKHFSCITDAGEQLSITINTEAVDGFSAQFYLNNGNGIYIDSAVKDSDLYVVYPMKRVLKESSDNLFHDEVLGLEDFSISNLRHKVKRQDSGSAYIFKIAIVTSKEWSAYHGDTVPSVLAAVVTSVARLNAVYAHEFGVFFELIADADLGFCFDSSSSSACQAYGNDSSVIDQSAGVLSANGVPLSSYDIGHGLTTEGGGLAQLGSLCSFSSKANGMTGHPNPDNDSFWIDYLSHEVGHQFFGFHSFRDCQGSGDGNAGVEPGSGSTIMGYAGICGSDNVQPNSDPYFNNLNQEVMYDHVLSVTANGCGTTISLSNELPILSAPIECTVPANTPFQLKGTTTSPAERNSFFSWDRIDVGSEDFSSTTLGKFRSWKPTQSQSRFFPNLQFLAFNTNQNVERLPAITRDMTFRFTERRLYTTDLFLEDFSTAQMGDFVFTDTDVNFVSGNPLEVNGPAAGTTVASGESLTVQWTPSLGSEVEIYIAVDELVEVADFDYEDHNIELNWTFVASATMSAGSASVVIPTISENVENAILMVRGSTSSDFEGCYFFDIVRNIVVTPGDGVITSAPTLPPTDSPTIPATDAPTTTAPTTSAPTTASPTNPPVPTAAPVPTASPVPVPGTDGDNATMNMIVLATSVAVFLVALVACLCSLSHFISTKKTAAAAGKKPEGRVFAAKGLAYENTL